MTSLARRAASSFLAPCFFLLAVPNLGVAQDRSNRLPQRTTWHEGWISLSRLPRFGDTMTAVLHNRGKDLVFVSMGGHSPATTLLYKTRDGWKDAGPGF